MKKWFVLILAPAILFAADLTDNDGDGLPDLWEANFGLSTNSLNGADGINGAWGDPDDDGLNNMGEYLAGYTVIGGNVYSNYAWAVSGLNPTNANSILGGLPDGFCRVSTNKVPLNWMFGDHDMVDSIWEAISSNEASAFLPETSFGSKKWSQFDRCRMQLEKCSPKVRLNLSSDNRTIDKVTIVAYSDLTKKYDAKWVVDGCNKMYVLGTPDIGELQRKSCFWLAYSGNDAWVVGAPLGYAYTASNNWDETYVGIDLKSYSGHYFMYTIPTPIFSSGTQKTETRVRVRRVAVDGAENYQMTFIDKTVSSDGTFASGLDAFAKGWLGLDWGLEGAPLAYSRVVMQYDVWVGSENVLTNNNMVLKFTNRLDTVQFRPTISYPSGGTAIRFARPKIRFSMPDDYQAFSAEIRANNASGASILSNSPVYVPTKISSGEYEWTVPISVGDRTESGSIFSNNSTYVYRLAAFNSKFTPAIMGDIPPLFSDWKTFSTRVDEMNGDAGTIAVSLRYPGVATGLINRVVVEARTCRGTSQYPDCRYTLSNSQVIGLTNLSVGATNVLLSGLAHGTYYVSAFVDSNTNRIRDVWESWGYSNMRGVAGHAAYDFNPIVVGVNRSSKASIIIEDADIDSDWYPDCWEYERTGGTNNWLGTYGPSPSLINPLLQ